MSGIDVSQSKLAEIQEMFRKRWNKEGEDPDDRRYISVRELEVFKLMMKGLRDQEIADLLKITLSTVKSHTHTIYDKIGISGRTRLMALLADKKEIWQ
jgi:DNA-binding NarL/FixJ family response regulator